MVTSGAASAGAVHVQQQHCCMVGKGSYDLLSEDVLQVVNLKLCDHGFPTIQSQQLVQKFYKMMIRKSLFFSLEYKRVKSRNSYTVVYIEDGREQFGKILFFLQLYTTSFVVLSNLQSLPVTCQAHFGLAHSALDIVHKLIPVNDGDSLKCVPASAIVCKCVYMAIDGKTYVVTFPNELLDD